jgi:thiS family protein
VTVTELAEENGHHVSSVRETLEALYALGLVTREQMPISGRGRPAHGYITYTPTDPAFPARMLEQATQAVFSWLRESADDPKAAAFGIGAHWADAALKMNRVPDHATSAFRPGFRLVDHMDKIRLFLTAMGFAAAAHPEEATSLVLGACPYTDPDDPDPLALELRRGVVERILERTSAGKADVAYLPDPANPVRVLVRLTERDEPRRRPRPTRVRFFGGAEEAAEAAVIDVDPDETPATLGELLAELSARRPRLAAVLDVSSFIVDHRTATRRTPLHAGADVEVLPPFSGG